MRILVTGGAGFIGSQYVRMLLTGALTPFANGRVTVLDKLTYAGNLANLDPVREDPRLTFVHGDICDSALADDLMTDHDVVVHFAAETHVDRSIESSTEFVVTNVLGTQALLDAARRRQIGRFVHVSTDEVYGSIDIGSWTEDSPVAPNSPYAASKASADLIALAYYRTHGLDVVVTRGSNNYGPYQFPEKVIPLFITNLLDGDTVPIYGDGANIRDWLHVSDHCSGIHLALTKGRSGEVYHIGGGAELTNLELARQLVELCGGAMDRIRHVADRKGHDRRYSLDFTKSREELGYQPKVSLADGLAATVAWYRANRTWWEPLKQRATLAWGAQG